MVWRKRFESREVLHSDDWSGAVEIFDSPGWWTSEWFGNYYKGNRDPLDFA